jgi:hypothetical protein
MLARPSIRPLPFAFVRKSNTCSLVLTAVRGLSELPKLCARLAFMSIVEERLEVICYSFAIAGEFPICAPIGNKVVVAFREERRILVFS